MKGEITNISREIIIKYINTDLSENELSDMISLRNSDPFVELWLNMIDNCKMTAGTLQQPGSISTQGASALVEKLLPEMLSGSYTSASARSFLSALQQSPDFYNLLLRKLDSCKHALATENKIAPDFPLVSDAEMFALVKEKAGASKHTRLSSFTQFFPQVRENIITVFARQEIKRLSFASLLIMIIITGGYFYITSNRNVNSIYSSYFNKQNPPYMFTASSLRGSADVVQNNSVYDTLESEFKMGISYYLTRDYDRAMQFFNRVLVVIGSQQTKPADLQSRRLLRECYFYNGISCMALAGEKGGNKSQLLQQAIVYLNSATRLEKIYNLKGGDRELFFSSLAYSQVGENELAMQTLEAIPENSSFTNDCEKLKQYFNSKEKKH